MAGLGTSVVFGATGDAEGNPYGVISDRNIFHLNDPPPPPPVDPPKPLDGRKLMLSGFLGKGASTRVLMAIMPKDNKESTVYLNLAPGERNEKVELVRIRLKEKEVDIVDDGMPMTLSVKSNSFASVSGPQPAAGGPPERPMKGGFSRPSPAAPVAGHTAPAAVAAAGQTGNGTIIIGGGNSGSQGGSGSGGAIVSGGSSAFGGGAGSYAGANNAIVTGGSSMGGGIGSGAYANNTGAQNTGVPINSLFNPQTGRGYGVPTSPPAPPREVQAAAIALQAAAGGPPAPPPPPGTEGQ
jgi:hypothetical protein